MPYKNVKFTLQFSTYVFLSLSARHANLLLTGPLGPSWQILL